MTGLSSAGVVVAAIAENGIGLHCYYSHWIPPRHEIMHVCLDNQNWIYSSCNILIAHRGIEVAEWQMLQVTPPPGTRKRWFGVNGMNVSR